jgi:hypothetical protein
MKRTDLLDTSEEIHKKLLVMLREKGPVWCIQKAIQLTDDSRETFPEQTKSAIRKLSRKQSRPFV